MRTLGTGFALALAALCSCRLDTSHIQGTTDATSDGTVDAKADGTTDAPSDARDSSIGDVHDDGTDATDSEVPETTVDADTGVVDGGGDADALVDTGPPDVGPPECTVAGPSGTDTVCIPARTFSLGDNNTTACSGGCANEKPEVSVNVSEFVLDRYEVTVGNFRAWWNAGHAAPSTGTNYFGSLKWKAGWTVAEPAMSGDCTWAGASVSTNDAMPLNCVNWYTALAYCVSKTMRLPTEAEWEDAASAGQDRLFPWSPATTEDDPFSSTDVDCAHAIWGSGCGTPKTYTPSSTIWGLSRNGAYNLSGGVAEWTLDGTPASVGGWTFASGSSDPVVDPGLSTSTARIVRGGSYASSLVKDLRAAARPTTGTDPAVSDQAIGFRCAKR